MTTGVALSVLLLAAGAILVWAVTASIAGVSLTAIGVIMIIAGFAVLLASLRASGDRADRSAPRR